VPGLEQRCHPFGVSVDVSRFAPLPADQRLAARRRLGTELGLSSASRLVLFAGRLEAVKRPMMILAIARELADGDAAEPVHVIVAGTGSLGPELERERRTGDRVHLLGPVSHDRISELMPAVDALVLPSGFEALPNVVLESLASGTPVVVSQQAGGARELVESDGVGMVAGDTPGAFADAIRGVLAWEGSRTDRCVSTAARHAPALMNAPVYEGMARLAPDTAEVGAGV
jgi:glycosyltransferase involved in cell wall biosynthesis